MCGEAARSGQLPVFLDGEIPGVATSPRHSYSPTRSSGSLRLVCVFDPWLLSGELQIKYLQPREDGRVYALSLRPVPVPLSLARFYKQPRLYFNACAHWT